jgi:exodeoxyribonuclease V gamma subunit
MTIHAIVSTRADALLPHLVKRIETPQADEFLPDTLVVPSAALGAWLSEQLALSLRCADGSPGVLANVQLLLPADFYSKIEGLTGAKQEIPHWSSASEDACQLLNILLEQPDLAPSFRNVSDRVAYVLKVSRLFERYSIERPDMLTAWLAGQPTDGVSALLDRHQWQFQAWCELQRRSIATVGGRSVRAGSRDGVGVLGRISLFGLEVLSPRAVRILESLPRNLDVMLYGTTPSRSVLDLGGRISQALKFVPHPKRDDFLDFYEPRHPLLRTWAKSAAESAFLLSKVASTIEYVEPPRTSGLLGQVQRDLADGTNLDEVVPGAPFTDGSIVVHRCHGLVRQVEVARDAVLHLLDRDPTLRLRDVLVVSPKVERFAKLIGPVFGVSLRHETDDNLSSNLDTTILDGAPGDPSEFSAFLQSLLALAGGRCTRTDVLGVLGLETVRTSLDFDSEALKRVEKWLQDIDVRWGVSAAHREKVGYPAGIQQSTWSWAAQKLAAGAYVQAPIPIDFAEQISPYDDVGSGDVATLIRLVGFLQFLEHFHQFGSEPRILADWHRELGYAIDNFIPAVAEFKELREEAAQVQTRLSQFASLLGDTPVSAREVASLLAGELEELRPRARRWADVVRVGSLGRLRGIPARVIVVLGLDDDALSAGSRDGDDVLGSAPRVGERDRRSDERLALLATVAAATEHLIITTEGFSVTNNKKLAPGISQSELLDAVRRSRSTQQRSLPEESRPLVVSHTRQLSHPVNLGIPVEREDQSVFEFHQGPWTFDSSAEVLAGVNAASQAGSRSFMDVELPAPGEDEIEYELELEDLAAVVKRPVRVLVRDRLRSSFRDEETASDEDLMIWPDGMARAALGRSWIELVSDGLSEHDVVKRLRLMGALLPGALGDQLISQLSSEIGRMFEKVGGVATTRQTLDADLRFAEYRLRDQIVLADDEIRVLDYAKHHPSRLALPWVSLAVAVKQLHGRDVICRVVTRSDEKDNKDPVLTVLKMIGTTNVEREKSADRVLEYLIGLRFRALRRAVPILDRATWAIAFGFSESKIKVDLERELEKPELRWTGLARDSAQLLADDKFRADEEQLSESESRLHGYASELRNCFSSTVVMTEEERD